MSLAALGLVTGAIYVCKSFVPVLSLGVLYLFAVLPVAVLFGRAYAITVALASAGLFNFLFLPPIYTLRLSDGEHWFALAVYLVVGIVASDLAVRARQRAAEAEQRGREEALLAQMATAFLQAESAIDELERFAPAIADVLHAADARIVLGPSKEPPPGRVSARAHGGRPYASGRSTSTKGSESSLAIRRRFLPALASLVAVAVDRERLAREAVEAEALRRSDTIKTAVLQAVSHDLRSPLTAIKVAAESLSSTGLALDEADRAGLLETVRLEVDRLERVVGNLLDISRLQAGAAEPNRELWAVEELLAQALEQLAAADRVALALPAETAVVEVDAIQVERVLVNLLENALKFSPPGEAVHVRVTTTRSEVIVRIVDRGPGIPPSELERIFEPFARVASAEDRGGSGLGLAIAKGFAEGNGGRVWAESQPGQGASLVLALPLVEVPVGAEA